MLPKCLQFSHLYPDVMNCHEIDELLHAEGKCLSLRESVDPSAMYTASLRMNLLEDVRLGNIGRLQQRPPPEREVKVCPVHFTVICSWASILAHLAF